MLSTSTVFCLFIFVLFQFIFRQNIFWMSTVFCCCWFSSFLLFNGRGYFYLFVINMRVTYFRNNLFAVNTNNKSTCSLYLSLPFSSWYFSFELLSWVWLRTVHGSFSVDWGILYTMTSNSTYCFCCCCCLFNILFIF